MAAPILDAFSRFFEFLWLSFLLLAPMLLLGLFLGGLIHVFISREAILRWLRHDDLKSVATSAAIGVPVPLCSCSVVPVVAEMRRKGASRSACMSFLITAPETGADSILVTNAFFGVAAAIVRPVISFITAVVAGIFCIGLIRDDRDEPRARLGHRHGCDHDHGVHQPLIPNQEDCYVNPSELKRASVRWMKGLALAVRRRKYASRVKPGFHHARMLADDRAADASLVEATVDGQLPGFRTIIRHVFRYGFVEIADDILFALLVGIALGGLLYLAIPSDLMANEYARWVSYPVMILIGVPLYICASASTPIAAALVAKGVSPGAALIFLMTGPGDQYRHHRDHHEPVRGAFRVHLRRCGHRGHRHPGNPARRPPPRNRLLGHRQPAGLGLADPSVPAIGRRPPPPCAHHLAIPRRRATKRLGGSAAQLPARLAALRTDLGPPLLRIPFRFPSGFEPDHSEWTW